MICRLMLVIHQRDSFNPQRPRRRDLCVRVVTKCEIESAIARPFTQSRGAPQKVAGLSRKRSAAVAADHVRHHSRFGSELNSMGKVARADFDLVPTRTEFRN